MLLPRIDTFANQIWLEECSRSISALYNLLHGEPQRAHRWPNGDQLYVSEKGFLPQKGEETFFFPGCIHPFSGYGVVVGYNFTRPRTNTRILEAEIIWGIHKSNP